MNDDNHTVDHCEVRLATVKRFQKENSVSLASHWDAREVYWKTQLDFARAREGTGAPTPPVV